MIKTEIEIIDVLLMIAFALIFARFFGFLFYKIKQPAVLGEIIAGILLGAIGVYLIHGQALGFIDFTLPNLNFNSPGYSSYYDLIAEIGILFLLFISGLEISVSRLKKKGKTSVFVAVGGITVPFVLGFLSCYLISALNIFDFEIMDCILVGLILTATSVGVTVRVLMDIDALDTDVGATILGSAVLDDIFAIILLAIVVGVDSIFGALKLIIVIAIFFIIFLFIGLKIIDKILGLGEKIHLPKAFLSISLAILLIYSYFAEKAGISGIIGAFIAGVIIGQSVRSVKLEADIKAIAYGFFVPFFFVWVGASLWKDTGAIFPEIGLILILVLVISFAAIIGKIIGCGLGAKLGGMSNKESLQVGIGMIPRMELALIIVTTAFTKDIVEENIASLLLIITIIITVITVSYTHLRAHET